MLTIYTGHHLEKVAPNVNLEQSPLDAPETTIRKATTIFEHAKATSIIIRTNDILFLDTIRTVAMENDMLDAVAIIHTHKDHTSHQLKFDENENLNSPCHYSSAQVEMNNRFYKILYEKRRKKD